MTTKADGSRAEGTRLLEEVNALADAVDRACYDAVAGTPTPRRSG